MNMTHGGRFLTRLCRARMAGPAVAAMVAVILAAAGCGGSPSSSNSGAPGAAATFIYATAKGWGAVIPALAWGGGIGAAVAIGAIAGLVPALRAARLSPTEALRTT